MRPYIVRKMTENGHSVDVFSQGVPYSLSCVGQPGCSRWILPLLSNSGKYMLHSLPPSHIFIYLVQSAHREFILRCAYLEIYNEVGPIFLFVFGVGD